MKEKETVKGKQLLLTFIRDHIWSYVAGILILLFSSFCAMLIPKILGIITDGLDKRNMAREQIYQYVLLMLGAIILVFILKYIWRYLLIGNCRTVECYLRDNLFKHLQTLSVDFYSHHKTGDLVAYAINDIQAVRFMFGGGFVQALDGITISVVSIIFMANTINPILTVMALAPVPVAAVIMVRIGKLIRERFKRVQEAFADISDKVQENLSGIRVIKAFAQEREEVLNFTKFSQARVDTQMKLTQASAIMGPSAQICFGFSFLFFIVYGSRLVMDGTISLGDYIAFNTYMITVMGPVMNISKIIETWQRGIASYRRLNEIFCVPPALEGTVSICDVCEIKGKIEIRNLSFTYPEANRRALKDINIQLEQGKTLGILGKTGSGKTTLINLLLRLFDVKDGHIFVDGIDINKIPVDVLRECIGYVPQDNFLFSTTIKNNIEFFKPVHSDDEIEEVSKISAIYDNIMELQEGFDTVVGERGTTLSGGQKQRVSIARALIKDPSILILDDSLSAVDSKTEETILGNIRDVLESRTGIIISHRISTVMHADEIIYLENGRIVERGTHAQLMELEGNYFKLYKTQTNQAETLEEVVK
ncbi:ABC transporter ATP-binding protein [Ruminiclostridium cellobioparum]|uniref:ABC transporter ATP-binding protein n=1 Tax=Ruminiclostridium cellobioparum TaxID=29355 RepID=UPI001FA7F3E6|nr:ABC transporter ATP-binding protein [Ruminiclostridium cellobioparum]